MLFFVQLQSALAVKHDKLRLLAEDKTPDLHCDCYFNIVKEVAAANFTRNRNASCMAICFNCGIKLDGCACSLTQASSDRSTATRVEESDPAFWTMGDVCGGPQGVVDFEEVGKQKKTRRSEYRVASAVVASAGDELAGDEKCELRLIPDTWEVNSPGDDIVAGAGAPYIPKAVKRAKLISEVAEAGLAGIIEEITTLRISLDSVPDVGLEPQLECAKGHLVALQKGTNVASRLEHWDELREERCTGSYSPSLQRSRHFGGGEDDATTECSAAYEDAKEVKINRMQGLEGTGLFALSLLQCSATTRSSIMCSGLVGATQIYRSDDVWRLCGCTEQARVSFAGLKDAAV